jgi:hypothetical protein
VHAFETAGKVDSDLTDLGGFDKKGRSSVDCSRFSTMTILGNKIPSKSFNSGVNCNKIKLRLSSALLFTVTATCEGLFSPLEECFIHLGTIIIVLHSFLAQFLEPSIVYIFYVPVEILLWQS